MVKRAHELDDIEREAVVAYEETRLARLAIPARRRLVLLALAAGAAIAGFAALYGAWGWLAAALVALLAALLLRNGRLAGIALAGLCALVAVLLPLALAGLHISRAWAPLALSVVLGLAALPDLVTLVRDAELQHAYGKWAKRKE